MTEFVKETITTQGGSANPGPNTPVEVKATNSQRIGYIVYFFFGLIEVLLAFRLVLKFTGASMASAFVRLIYSLTGIFILPFEGIFRRGISEGIETKSIFEPSTLVAIVVYMLLAWGIVKLIGIFSGNQEEE
jgi:hypothetical protein